MVKENLKPNQAYRGAGLTLRPFPRECHGRRITLIPTALLRLGHPINYTLTQVLGRLLHSSITDQVGAKWSLTPPTRLDLLLQGHHAWHRLWGGCSRTLPPHYEPVKQQDSHGYFHFRVSCLLTWSFLNREAEPLPAQ